MSTFHGSDIEKIAALHQIDPEKLINFAVNANPLGLSPKAKQALCNQIDLIGSYPDPSYNSLKNAISQYLAVDFERILPCNGSSELIHQIIQDFAPQKAILYHPTYSEYAHEVKKIGGQVLPLPLLPENDFRFPLSVFYQLLAEADFVLLCNPNNPSTTLLTTQELSPLIQAAKEKNCPFVIDESYVEFTDNPSEYSAVSLLSKFDNLIILRGFSKFFASPGLRLGYGLFGSLEYLSRFQNSYPWSVHALAVLGGQMMLADTEYIKFSRHYIQTERERVLKRLENMPFLKVYSSPINFFLLKLEQKTATELFLYLLQHGFLIRNFDSEIGSGFFRFCLMKKEENNQLLDAIESFLKS